MLIEYHEKKGVIFMIHKQHKNFDSSLLFFIILSNFDNHGRIGKPIIDVYIGSIIIINAIHLFVAIALMNVPEYVCLWFDNLYKFKQTLAASVFFSYCKIQYSIGRSMSNQNIDVFGYIFP